MSGVAFDPRAFVLRKDIHPIEIWSPGARVRIHVPAVPPLGTVIAVALGALAGGAVIAVFAFAISVADPIRWAAIAAGAAAGALWAGRKFHEMFEEHDVTMDWISGRATFRHGRDMRSVLLKDIQQLVLRGLKTRHEPGDVAGPTASYTAYWCRLEAQLSDGQALIIEGDPTRDPHSARVPLEAMGGELARALGVQLRFEDYREMSAREYFL